MCNNYNVCTYVSFIQFIYVNVYIIHSVHHYVLCILLSASCNSVYCRSEIKVLVSGIHMCAKGFNMYSFYDMSIGGLELFQ